MVKLYTRSKKPRFLFLFGIIFTLFIILQDTSTTECCGSWCPSCVTSVSNTIRGWFGGAPATQVPLSLQGSIHAYQATPPVPVTVQPGTGVVNLPPQWGPLVPPMNLPPINVDPLPVEQCTIEMMVENFL